MRDGQEAQQRALERVIELVEPAPADPDTDSGYLDLLGSEQQPAAGLGQALMRTRTVPAIYERWWRPALGRVAKGVGGPSMAAEYRMVRGLLDVGPGDRVLDVACGPGNFTRELARDVTGGGLAVGIDASETMLGRAVHDTTATTTGAGVVGAVGYAHGSAVPLPFRPASFDAACCFAALHLFAEPLRALDEMARVLVPGGRIAVLTSRRRGIPPLHLADTALGLVAGMTMFDRDGITAALEERGFTDVHQRVFGLAQLVSARRFE